MSEENRDSIRVENGHAHCNVLVIAAHPDDEILGPSGTIARHVCRGDQVAIAIVADVGTARYGDETIATVRSYTVEAAKRLGVLDVRFAGWADQKLDTLPILDITQWIEAILDGFRPQVIFTHHRGDINRDHRIVHEATLTAARPYSAP